MRPYTFKDGPGWLDNPLKAFKPAAEREKRYSPSLAKRCRLQKMLRVITVKKLDDERQSNERHIQQT